MKKFLAMAGTAILLGGVVHADVLLSDDMSDISDWTHSGSATATVESGAMSFDGSETGNYSEQKGNASSTYAERVRLGFDVHYQERTATGDGNKLFTNLGGSNTDAAGEAWNYSLNMRQGSQIILERKILTGGAWNPLEAPAKSWTGLSVTYPDDFAHIDLVRNTATGRILVYVDGDEKLDVTDPLAEQYTTKVGSMNFSRFANNSFDGLFDNMIVETVDSPLQDDFNDGDIVFPNWQDLGAETPTVTSGALKIDGSASGDYIVRMEDELLEAPAFHYSFDVYFQNQTDTSDANKLFATVGGGGDGGTSWSYQINMREQDNISIRRSYYNGSSWDSTSYTGSVVDFPDYFATVELVRGQTDTGVLQLFVDGTQVLSFTDPNLSQTLFVNSVGFERYADTPFDGLIDNVNFVVPEPASAVLLLLGAAALLSRRRRA